MSRYDRRDILLELIELCRELNSDLIQQLNYYRASVYKNETATVIEQKVEQLALIANLFGHDELNAAFLDYVFMKKNGSMMAAPGECLLSVRISSLSLALDQIFEELLKQLPQLSCQVGMEFSLNLQNHRQQLLSLCRQGSRQWTFFTGL